MSGWKKLAAAGAGGTADFMLRAMGIYVTNNIQQPQMIADTDGTMYCVWNLYGHTANRYTPLIASISADGTVNWCKKYEYTSNLYQVAEPSINSTYMAIPMYAGQPVPLVVNKSNGNIALAEKPTVGSSTGCILAAKDTGDIHHQFEYSNRLYTFTYDTSNSFSRSGIQQTNSSFGGGYRYPWNYLTSYQDSSNNYYTLFNFPQYGSYPFKVIMKWDSNGLGTGQSGTFYQLGTGTGEYMRGPMYQIQPSGDWIIGADSSKFFTIANNWSSPRKYTLSGNARALHSNGTDNKVFVGNNNGKLEYVNLSSLGSPSIDHARLINTGYQQNKNETYSFGGAVYDGKLYICSQEEYFDSGNPTDQYQKNAYLFAYDLDAPFTGTITASPQNVSFTTRSTSISAATYGSVTSDFWTAGSTINSLNHADISGSITVTSLTPFSKFEF